MNTIAQEWIAEGREQGIQQGMTQGAIQATRENIMELLDSRFGNISAEAATTIISLEDLPRLKTLLKQAATAKSLAEFEALLQRPPFN